MIHSFEENIYFFLTGRKFTVWVVVRNMLVVSQFDTINLKNESQICNFSENVQVAKLFFRCHLQHTMYLKNNH